MKTEFLLSLCTAILLIPNVLGADDVQKPKVMSAEEAFDFFTTIDGTWNATTVTVPAGTSKDKGETKQSKISYETLANGTAVMATYFKGSPMQMIDMIHQDGSEMVRLTHYCAVGNQPRMKFVKSDKPGVIQFAFDGGSNMDVDGHVHDSSVRILDSDHFEVESRLWSDGQHAMTTYFAISRSQ